ncbi:MAG: hypothetical protein ACOYL6_15440 [Bacteriovoracaceae bacterium]
MKTVQTFIFISLIIGILSFGRSSLAAPICDEKFQSILTLNGREILVLSNVYGLRRIAESDELMFDLFEFSESVVVARPLYIKKKLYQLFIEQVGNVNRVEVAGEASYKSLLDVASFHSFNFPLSQNYPKHSLFSFKNTESGLIDYLWKIDAGATEASHTFVQTLQSSYLDFVIEGYAKRLGNIDSVEFEHLREISISVKNRTIAIVKTTNGPNFAENNFQGLSGNPDIEGVITAVLSRSESEKLPLEILNEFSIKREKNEVIAEIGRFYVKKDGPKNTTPELISYIAHFLNAKDLNPQRLIIQVDGVHKRLFSPFGFQVIKSFEGIQGKEYILEVTPATLKKKTIELLGDWEGLSPEQVQKFKNRWL